MGEDTADCIAHEMMEDLSLSAEEAELIAVKIKQEIGRIAGEYVDSHSQQLLQLGAGEGEGGGADTAGSDSLSRLSALSRDAITNAAAAAVVAVASAAAAANSNAAAAAAAANSSSSSVGGMPPLSRSGLARQQTSEQPKSGPHTPKAPGSNRPPSLHDIVRAMREFNAQQLEEAAAAAPPGAGDGQGGGTLEVVLPAGHALDTRVLARVASAAASAAAQQLAENSLSPPRNTQHHQQQPSQQQQQPQ